MQTLIVGEEWSVGEWEAARARFSYPPNCLVERDSSDNDVCIKVEDYDLHLAERRLESSEALDAWHHGRIHAPDARTRLAALLSIFYWGYYASPNDPARKNGYVVSRTNVLMHGRAHHPRPNIDRSLAALGTGLKHLSRGSSGIEAAIREITQIRYAGVSFGSKVLAFADPETAVVYDEVVRKILERWAPLDPAMASMAVSKHASIERRVAAYSKWCAWCVAKAAELNRSPSALRSWRAVDVERAVFSLGR